MVYAFLIHSLSTGSCHVLFSAIYASDTPQNTLKFPSDDLREINKRSLMQVASRVQSEFSFRCAVGGNIPNTNELLVTTGDEVYPGDPFKSEKVVIWRGFNNCAFTMICEENENRIAAQNVLGLIIKFVHQHCDVISRPHEVLLKPDKVEAVLHHFLPCGQLLLMNHRIVRQFEKELNLTINSKS